MKHLLLLLITYFFLSKNFSQVTFTSSDLPVISINTNGQEIVDDPKIMASMGIINNGAGIRNSITDPFNQYNGKIGIEIRGQSSQMFPMKSYSIELWNNSGNSINQSLFGLPSESDWVLYAPYNDKTLMHNFMAYTLSRSMGHWAANCRYVELLLNGEYKGIYVFMEKIKRNSGRVNISKMASSDISGDALTGGYIISIDKEANAWYSPYTPSNAINNQAIQFSYVTPKITDIAQQQKDYIRAYVDSFENALHGISYQDKQTGWRKYADENSFIDYFIINEVSRNVDGYRLSAYFYKNRYSKGGKLIAGPVWDYDLSFRNADYCNGSNTDGWAYEFNSVCPGDYWHVPFWWDKLMSDTGFVSDLRCRWKELRQTTLSTTGLNHLIDSVVNLTAEARGRHFTQWPVLGVYVWPNPSPIPASYTGEISTLKTWLQARISWIDSQLPNIGNCYDYPASAPQTMTMDFYPNPVSTNGSVIIRTGRIQPVKVVAIDEIGRNVYNTVITVKPGINNMNIPMANWSTGIYYFTFTSEKGEIFTARILKG
jgi:hypothetical protein